jgi:hypothetical protein
MSTMPAHSAIWFVNGAFPMNKSRQQYDPWREDPDPPTPPLDENKLEEYFRKEKERKEQEKARDEKASPPPVAP